MIRVTNHPDPATLRAVKRMLRDVSRRTLARLEGSEDADLRTLALQMKQTAELCGEELEGKK